MVLGFVAGHGCDLLDSRDRKGRARNGFFTASTFELSFLRRHALLGRGRKIAHLPWSGQAKHVVAGQLERVVRPDSCLCSDDLCGKATAFGIVQVDVGDVTLGEVLLNLGGGG